MRLFLAAIIVAAIGGLAGCGGSDSGSSGDVTTTVTKASFVKQGEAICREAEKERAAALKRATENLSSNPTLAEREASVAELLPPIARMASSLRELTPPEGEEEEVEAILKALEESLAEAEQNPGAAANGEAFNTYDEHLGRYGMPGCAI
jgi:hypothetical protein